MIDTCTGCAHWHREAQMLSEGFLEALDRLGAVRRLARLATELELRSEGPVGEAVLRVLDAPIEDLRAAAPTGGVS